ncbi:MAG: mechanosensitive ion channel protein MscS [Phycisphaerae bacterium]|nr:mechanosensitive ion channel protein MscS [Phycisphaerae bacterium]
MELLTSVVANIQVHLCSLFAMVEPASNVNGSKAKFVEHSSVGLVRAFGESSMKRYLENWFNWIHSMLTGWGVKDQVADWLTWVVFGAGILVACILLNYIAKLAIKAFVNPRLLKHDSNWSDAIAKSGVILRLSHFIPLLLLAVCLPLLFSEAWQERLLPFLTLYGLWVVLIVGYALIELGGDLYQAQKGEDRSAILGLIQACKLIITLIAIILGLSIMFSKSPVYFLSGIGAFMAIFLLIFKDTLLGLVAGLQLGANDMVRVGDWIAIPGTEVDGDVVELSLTTVQVSNWDRTIAMVPAYDLFQKPFINWRGMSDSGGRRIKRSINIDISTIQFATGEMLDKWGRIKLLEPYLQRKQSEILEWNKEQGVDSGEDFNARRQTNIGAFRAYIEAYLRNHPKIHQTDFTFLVRQLQPTSEGLPVEVYVFTNDNRWVEYEGIQSDIFDHLLAVVPYFDLEVHELPSGSDVRNAESQAAAAAAVIAAQSS